MNLYTTKVAVDYTNTNNVFITISGNTIVFMKLSSSLSIITTKMLYDGLSSSTVVGIGLHSGLNTVHFYYYGKISGGDTLSSFIFISN
jgi:hypothetical protein